VTDYSIFALLIGLAGWFAMADFGVGVSLQNHISERRTKGQFYGDLIYTAVILELLGLVFATCALVVLAIYFAPSYLQSDQYLSTLGRIRIFLVTGVLFSTITIGGIISRILYAEQKGYWANLLAALGWTGSLFGILIVSRSVTNGRLLWSIVGYLLPQVVVNTAALFYRIHQIPINQRCYRHKTGKSLIHLAGRFWLFAILSAVVLQMDYIIISQYGTTKEIILYNVATKAFSFAAMVFTALLQALWPEFAEQAARLEWDGIRKKLKICITIGISFTVIWTAGSIFGLTVLVGILAPGRSLYVPMGLVLLLGLYQLTRVWSDSYAMVLQSCSHLGPLWRWVPTQAVISGVLQWWMMRKWGINGLIGGLTVSFLSTVCWALPNELNRLIIRRKALGL